MTTKRMRGKLQIPTYEGRITGNTTNPLQDNTLFDTWDYKIYRGPFSRDTYVRDMQDTNDPEVRVTYYDRVKQTAATIALEDVLHREMHVRRRANDDREQRQNAQIDEMRAVQRGYEPGQWFTPTKYPYNFS